MGVVAERVPARVDHEHERMWSLSRHRWSKQHVQQHVLEGIRRDFMHGTKSHHGERLGYGELSLIGRSR
jgi:hypothetical protein